PARSNMAAKIHKFSQFRHSLLNFSRYKAYRLLSTSQRCRVSVKSNNDVDDETHFGFERVKESEKGEKVYEVFHRVADTYDLMNDAMSGGVHRLWKDHYMEKLAPTPGTKLLDVAGGTGDIAFRFLKYVENEGEAPVHTDQDFMFDIPIDVMASDYMNDIESDKDVPPGRAQLPGSHVTVCDINQAMLQVGKDKSRALNHPEERISWVRGNAENLPIPDNTYDAYTIAFGIRNCTHVDKVLDEAYRVLKPGGRFTCLEFSKVNNTILRNIYDQYSFQVIPVLGQLLAKDWRSYQYLVESIRQFPNQETFKSMIEEAGFSAVTYENLTFGVATIHSGYKL
ncbi:unnamed protein product, partial [Owenia fusiformis]